MRVTGITLLWLLGILACVGQADTYNFHHLDQGQGLNEGTIRSFSRDRYGYMWIGATSGLNRFNGFEVTSFLHDHQDPGSIMSGEILAIHCHPNGTLWIGGEQGLMEYNYVTASFEQVNAAHSFAVHKFLPRDSTSLYVATSKGLAILDVQAKTITRVADGNTMLNDSLIAYSISDMAYNDHTLYMTTRFGLIAYDASRNVITRIQQEALRPFRLYNIAVHKDNTLWLTAFGSPHLIRTHATKNEITISPYIFPERASNLANTITDIMVDRDDRLWLTTTMDGLCYYDRTTQQFHNLLNEPLQPQTLSVNHLNTLHQDGEGFIWLGTEGYGVNYFHPDQQLFSSILPQTGRHSAWSWMWARSFTEDIQGQYWMATGEGVVRFNPAANETQAWRNVAGEPNQIHYNSVRGVLADNAFVWILTGRGINRFNTKTGQMEFFDAADGLPAGFYFSGMKASDNKIWFCTRDHDGIYVYDPLTDATTGIRNHAILKPLAGLGGRALYEDKQGKIWIGLNGSGLALFDPEANTLTHWRHNEADSASLADDLVLAITEDHQGIIWTSGINGLTSFDPVRNRWQTYQHSDGLPTNKTSCLMVDDQNRLWIGTAKGLAVLDSARRNFKSFDVSDGLPAYEFADMPGYRAMNGDFIFPTMRGFVRFDPDAYQSNAQTPTCYISGFHLFNGRPSWAVNAEELEAVQLKAQQNYFTIELTSPFFHNPSQVWYAYKLDGLDPQWHFTQHRTIQYTNLPGGSYTFLYRASSDNQHWTEAKALAINISTAFYKTWWYWAFIAASAAFIIYRYYQFRMDKQKVILELQSKTSALEKEKTQIQYETLKQQLNPHFLFNSLTSLRSLIRVDQKLATHFLDGLSKSYRYLLRSGDTELVSLADELNFVNTYVELQQTRFGNGLQVTVDVPADQQHRMIAPVALQNLMENAIKHNTISEDQPLCIAIYSENEYVVMQNNLQRYRQVETSNKRGLAGLQSLYRYHTSLPIIIIEDDQYFTVKIPLL